MTMEKSHDIVIKVLCNMYNLRYSYLLVLDIYRI